MNYIPSFSPSRKQGNTFYATAFMIKRLARTKAHQWVKLKSFVKKINILQF